MGRPVGKSLLKVSQTPRLPKGAKRTWPHLRKQPLKLVTGRQPPRHTELCTELHGTPWHSPAQQHSWNGGARGDGVLCSEHGPVNGCGRGLCAQPPRYAFKSFPITELCSVCSHPAQMVHSPLFWDLGTGPQQGSSSQPKQGLHMGCIVAGNHAGDRCS